MKIGIIIPDRSDRPDFLKNCMRMIKNQNLDQEIKKNIHIKIKNFPPKDAACDITVRYREGYDFFRGKAYDVIFLIENDDWYSPDYIKIMLDKWIAYDKPEILGTNYTYYYHLGMRKYKKLVHLRRASAMNTMLKPDLDIVWPKDHDPYTDLHLWKQLKGKTFEPEKIISIGMKHNIGKTGGEYHSTKLERYNENDSEMLFLNKYLDSKSFNFYKSINEKIRSTF